MPWGCGQPWDQPAGPGSPLAKLVEADGQVLMLGAPLDTLTLLHYAESLVDGPGKRMVTYAVPICDGEKVTWREVRDYDTSSRGLPRRRTCRTRRSCTTGG